ncbi:FAD-dependent monooxygenase [Pseudonocardia yunnanensis]|uniref:FAD-dependent monooxygenase n=1 Tax=Pseudonocardia yunnanensis TaxID=58107 RepID=A0ABW4EV79_9PSEU
MSTLRVAVVGGGIGGLFAAIALRERRMEATVYEQAAALSEIGAGLFVTPNSLRLLDRVGLLGRVEEAGALVGPNSAYFRDDGTPIPGRLSLDSSGTVRVYGMHRADLIEILAGALPAGTVATGHRCVGYEETDGGGRLRFTNGTTADADVVVGADGIHSVLQGHVVEPSTPVRSGSVAYRGLVPRSVLPGWPVEARLLWMGEGRHIIVYPVRGDTLLNFVGFVPADEVMRESWSAPGDPKELAAEFAGWDAPVGQLLEHVEYTFRSALHDREPLARWTAGHLTLLGDAAHPMLPHLGQGANQSIEDGMALATLLAASPEEPQRALLAYERIRKARTDAIQAGARGQGRRFDSEFDDLDERDAGMAESERFLQWLYDHDVLAEAEEEGLALR